MQGRSKPLITVRGGANAGNYWDAASFINPKLAITKVTGKFVNPVPSPSDQVTGCSLVTYLDSGDG